MIPKNRIIPVLLIVLLTVFVCCCSFADNGNVDFEVKRIGNIHSYADNAFRIRCSEAGIVEIRIHDNLCVYRIITEKIPAGETTIHWDGCGYNREKLYEKTYTVTCLLKTESGQIRTISFDSPVEYPSQCLQYALPSDSAMYLDRLDQWFLEYRTVTNGKLIIELISAENPSTSFSFHVQTDGGRIARKTFPEIAGKAANPPTAGNYFLSVYEASRPDEKYGYPLQILSSSPEPEPIALTGEIMPERDMPDDEIWQMMMKPSVVIDIDSFKHQDVYSAPDSGSVSLGTLHGQSQGLKVIRIQDEWALIGAWNHEEAAYIEGWVPLSRLKTEVPRGEYGILIDKQKQTMTVFRNGEVIDTLLVSTGRAEKNSLYQETAAGCFLTGYHRVNFSTNGKKYDYVIQYDGGNLLHQTPYDWGQQKKDFTLGRAYLGAKASHACVRIQPEPGAGGLNAYWLFTHLPYHTRVVILDDPWERESTAEKLKRSNRDDVDFSALDFRNIAEETSDNQVTITFCGCITPGGTRTFNSRKESFSSMIGQNGYDFPFGRLKNLFSEDDLTCLNLSCIIQDNPDTFPEESNIFFATDGTEQIFRDVSVELIQMTDERLLSSGQREYDETVDKLKSYTNVVRSDQPVTVLLNGHLFGFAGCTESEYLKSPEIIDQKIHELKEAGCEKTVMLVNWSDGHESAHSVVQEAVAHRCIRAGADLVVGDCPHLVQGIDFVEGTPVIYSLGDLLNGATAKKPKKQQGLLVRAVFSFDQEDVNVTVIPIMPYGCSDSKENEYCPDIELSTAQYENAIRNIWQDTSDAALKRISFCLQDQSKR